jgi:uncharacterized protein (TIGR02594 family)
MNLIKTALKEYGVKEIVGDKHNPTILQYFKEIGHEWVHNDELAWCSAYANAMAKRAGYEHTGKLNARSWLDIGKSVKNPEKAIEYGVPMVVVFWRKEIDSPWGHVAFPINFDENGEDINVLGGNQGNKVCTAPYKREKILDFRELHSIF